MSYIVVIHILFLKSLPSVRVKWRTWHGLISCSSPVGIDSTTIIVPERNWGSGRSSHLPKVTGSQASKLRLNSDLSDPRADGQSHGTSLLLSRGSTSSCGKTEARAGTSLTVVLFLLPVSVEKPTLHRPLPFPGHLWPLQFPEWNSAWVAHLVNHTSRTLADQLKTLPLFLLILLSFLLKRAQSFFPPLQVLMWLFV